LGLDAPEPVPGAHALRWQITPLWGWMAAYYLTSSLADCAPLGLSDSETNVKTFSLDRYPCSISMGIDVQFVLERVFE
jgi:hypothetical protein